MQLNFRSLSNVFILVISLIAWWFTSAMIRPELHYFLRQSAFLTESSFFMSFARYPGGLSDYLSEFIAQFFLFNTFGSFLIVAVASLLAIFAIQLVQRVAGKNEANFTIFGIILLLSVVLQMDYHYPFYASVRLLVTFILIWIYALLLQKSGWWSYVLAFAMALLVFYLAGGAALFVFTSSLVLIHIRFSAKKTDLFVLPLLVAFSVFLPYLAYKHIFLVDLSLVYSITHSKSPKILFYDADYKLYALYALLPASIFIALIFNKLKKKPEPTSANKLREKTNRKPWFSPVLRLGLQFILIVTLAILALNYFFDKTERDRNLVSFYGANGDWDNVIKTAKNIGEFDLFTNVEFNKALANKGQLADHIFDYKQLAGSGGLFVDEHLTSDVLLFCSDQYYDLGFMHESRHWAFEAQTILTNSPRLLKRLVLINLVIGNYKLVEKFLNQLNENMLYHDWVKKYSRYLEDTSLIEKDPELAWKRKCEPLGVFSTQSFRFKLDKLLEANPTNKMAFDYLLSSVLLDGDLGTFNMLIKEHPSLIKYPLPKVWDEAYVLFYYMSGKSPEAGEPKFSNDKKEQFIAFIKAMKPFENDWQSARSSLEKEFGTTYWYYLKCLSPKVTKVQIKKQKFDEEH